MANEERKIQAPQPNPETKAFWDAAAAGRLMIGKCTACAQVHYYPRAICPYCLSDKTELQQAGARDGGVHCARMLDGESDGTVNFRRSAAPARSPSR